MDVNWDVRATTLDRAKILLAYHRHKLAGRDPEDFLHDIDGDFQHIIDRATRGTRVSLHIIPPTTMEGNYNELFLFYGGVPRSYRTSVQSNSGKTWAHSRKWKTVDQADQDYSVMQQTWRTHDGEQMMALLRAELVGDKDIYNRVFCVSFYGEGLAHDSEDVLADTTKKRAGTPEEKSKKRSKRQKTLASSVEEEQVVSTCPPSSSPSIYHIGVVHPIPVRAQACTLASERVLDPIVDKTVLDTMVEQVASLMKKLENVSLMG